METYQVFLKNTDSIFFDGLAVDEDEAVKFAEAEYNSKYPEFMDDPEDNPEWSVTEVIDDPEDNPEWSVK